ncbi:hypothetical protein IGI04_023240 [Brassica rapa subsp. trilocularis]|uniref:Protein TSSC4 n=1 Tax=Brassica rapa subsp. trilocularis TaxID=1813537 RepID=A0ABQ7M3A6_BRACM|nr:hypothetical protein IGI04_023240 [Brassica rapa subsp. trilocularis]
MENTERDQPSIDGDTFPSSDDESEESTDTETPTSIDTAQPEAGKFSLTKPANEKVVQTELNGQTSNEKSQTEQGTEIPVNENSTLTKGEDIKLSIQDYLDPGRTYSNRSAIKIPGDDTKKSKFADYYRMVRQNPFQTRSNIAQIDDNALSDTDDYSDEETNCSDPYSTGKSNSHPIFLDGLDPNTSQENRKTTAEKAKEKAIDLELEEDTEIEDEIDRQYGTDVDRPKTPSIDRQPEKPVDLRSTQPDISDRTDDYMQLMDASIDVANVEENDDSEVFID